MGNSILIYFIKYFVKKVNGWIGWTANLEVARAIPWCHAAIVKKIMKIWDCIKAVQLNTKPRYICFWVWVSPIHQIFLTFPVSQHYNSLCPIITPNLLAQFLHFLLILLRQKAWAYHFHLSSLITHHISSPPLCARGGSLGLGSIHFWHGQAPRVSTQKYEVPQVQGYPKIFAAEDLGYHFLPFSQ